MKGKDRPQNHEKKSSNDNDNDSLRIMFGNLHPRTTLDDLKSAITKHFPESDILKVYVPRDGVNGFVEMRRGSGERALEKFGHLGMDVVCEAAGGERRRSYTKIATQSARMGGGHHGGTL